MPGSAGGTPSAPVEGLGGDKGSPDPALTKEAKLPLSDTTVQLSLVELRRSGKPARLQFTMTNTGGEAVTPLNFGRTGGITDVSGITLEDPVNLKRYRVALDSSDKCVCSPLQDILGPGQSVELFADFAVPPADVTTVDVTVPNFGQFTGLPVR